MELNVGDTLIMKKKHPCGANKMEITRTGADIKLRCSGCGHEMMLTRAKCEKNIRSVIKKETEKDDA